MAEVLLILLAGGLLLGTSLPNPAEAGPVWTRRVSALAMILLGAGAILAATLPREAVDVPPFYRRIQTGLILTTIAAALLHRVAIRFETAWTRRMIAGAGFLLAVMAGGNLLHEAMLPRGTAVAVPPKALSVALQTLSCLGAAAVPGVAFAYALFPVWGVTGPEESARSFRRLHLALLAMLSFRALVSVGGVLAFSPIAATSAAAAHVDPRLAAARWMLGIVAPALLMFLAFRRAAGGRPLTAGAMLLVGALCAMNGEAIALVLVRDTGLPY
jgi:hypothetical protein